MSFPEYHADHTKKAKYHDINIELKSTHPMANSANYSLSVEGSEQRPSSESTEMPPIPNPSPRGKGKKPKC